MGEKSNRKTNRTVEMNGTQKKIMQKLSDENFFF